MLRSIIIGFAIAAVLQLGVPSAATPDLASTAQRLNWTQVQSDSAAFVRLFTEGLTNLTR